MNLFEPTLHSLARATVVTAATLLLLLATGAGVRAARHRGLPILLWPAMASLLAPGFAIAITYFDIAMKRDAFGRDQFYCLLVWLRYSPLALLVVWLTPPAFSPEAMHCFRHAHPLPLWRRAMLELREWGRGLWLGMALVFLLAFQEFELATTWNMRAWPVALFDAQAGGLALIESLRLAAPPFLIQVLLIVILAWLVRRGGQANDSREFSSGQTAICPRTSIGLAVFLFSAVVGFLSLCAAPSAAIGWLASVVIFHNHADSLIGAPWQQIWNGLGIAAAATAFAWLCAGWIGDRRSPRWLLALPGLFGPMLCGLLLVALMQVPPLHLLRDTILPPVFGLMLVLLPFSLLLRLGIETTRDRAALHVARGVGAPRAKWQLAGWPQVCAVVLLFCFGYGDFTINSLLAPPQFTSASARLLNLLHYGRSSALMVMFTLSFAVPLAVALLTALFVRFYPRHRAS